MGSYQNPYKSDQLVYHAAPAQHRTGAVDGDFKQAVVAFSEHIDYVLTTWPKSLPIQIVGKISSLW
jgi:hypothetical protein